jgi:hypothetical protein
VRQADHLRRQAEACADLGSPMYADLLVRLADDLAAGGVTARLLAGHEDDPGPSVLGVRLLGSVHRLVLDRRAGELATFYPSVGGTWEAEGGTAAFLRLLDEQPDAVREWLDRPPQTNEVGRAGALMGGLLSVEESLRRPVRLFEIGSSAGLNLLVDRFTYDGAWEGRALPPWPGLRIVERQGSDLMPVDPTTTEGRLTLTAYVWPDQAHRLERLRAALALAQDVRVDVRRQDAASFVNTIDLRPDTLTVLWHSVMWQYLSAGEQARVTARIATLGGRATHESPFAHVFLEPTRRTPESEHEFLVVLETWPAGRRRILGTSVGHGVPTTWE